MIRVLVAALCSMPSGSRRAVHPDVEVAPDVVAAAEHAVRAAVDPVDLRTDAVDDEHVAGDGVVGDVFGVVAERHRADEAADVVGCAVLHIRPGQHECDPVRVVIRHEQHPVGRSVREARRLVGERGRRARSHQRSRPRRLEQVRPLVDGHLLDLGIAHDELVRLGDVGEPRSIRRRRCPREPIDRLDEHGRFRFRGERHGSERHLDDAAVGLTRTRVDHVQAVARCGIGRIRAGCERERLRRGQARVGEVDDRGDLSRGVDTVEPPLVGFADVDPTVRAVVRDPADRPRTDRREWCPPRDPCLRRAGTHDVNDDSRRFVQHRQRARTVVGGAGRLVHLRGAQRGTPGLRPGLGDARGGNSDELPLAEHHELLACRVEGEGLRLRGREGCCSQGLFPLDPDERGGIRGRAGDHQRLVARGVRNTRGLRDAELGRVDGADRDRRYDAR